MTEKTTQTTEEIRYFDLICTGVGFLNSPRTHSKGKGLSVTIKALRGQAGDKENPTESSRFDLDVVGSRAKELVKRLMEKFPQLTDYKAQDKPIIFIGFSASDLRCESITSKANPAKNILSIKGRLLKIEFIKINGELKYTVEKTKTEPVSSDEVLEEVIESDIDKVSVAE